MNDALAVGSIERVGDLETEREHVVEIHGTGCDAVFEGCAVEELHGDEGLALFLADVVNRADVGMVESGRGLGFALKAGQSLRIVRDLFGEKFEGDETMEACVLRFINNTHPATAQLCDDVVMRDGLPNHWRGILRPCGRQVNESQRFGGAAKIVDVTSLLRSLTAVH